MLEERKDNYKLFLHMESQDVIYKANRLLNNVE